MAHWHVFCKKSNSFGDILCQIICTFNRGWRRKSWKGEFRLDKGGCALKIGGLYQNIPVFQTVFSKTQDSQNSFSCFSPFWTDHSISFSFRSFLEGKRGKRIEIKKAQIKRDTSSGHLFYTIQISTLELNKDGVHEFQGAEMMSNKIMLNIVQRLKCKNW